MQDDKRTFSVIFTVENLVVVRFDAMGVELNLPHGVVAPVVGATAGKSVPVDLCTICL